LINGTTTLNGGGTVLLSNSPNNRIFSFQGGSKLINGNNTIIGGVLFGAFAGYTYWFPKAFGFRLHEGLGKAAFWFWLVGFYVAFMPLYVLGLEGMTRRMQHYDVAAWRPWLIVAAAGAGLILIGIACQILQLVVSPCLLNRHAGNGDGVTELLSGVVCQVALVYLLMASVLAELIECCLERQLVVQLDGQLVFRDGPFELAFVLQDKA